MSTTTTTVTPTAAPSFWTTLKSWLPALEMAANVALLATGFGAPFEPLVAQLENAANPLIQSIGTAQSITSTILTLYATIIGVLTALAQTPGLPSTTLETITGYITAAQNATAAYVTAESGFVASNYAPVTPIA